MNDETRSAIQFNLVHFMFGVTLICVALGMVSCCVTSFLWFLQWSDGADEIATIDCGDGREIVITAARSYEISQPLYYFVRVDGVVVVEPTMIALNHRNIYPEAIEFTKHTTDDGNLVGVTYGDGGTEYLLMHDFATGHSFPRGDHIKWDRELSVSENRQLRKTSRAELEERLNASRNQKENESLHPSR